MRRCASNQWVATGPPGAIAVPLSLEARELPRAGRDYLGLATGKGQPGSVCLTVFAPQAQR